MAFALGSFCPQKAVDVVKPTHNIVTSAHEVSDVVKSCEGSQDYSENPLMSNLKTNEQCQSARKLDHAVISGNSNCAPSDDFVTRLIMGWFSDVI